MKGLIKYVFWLLACPVFGQAVVFTSGVNYTSGAPTHNPGKANSRIAIDTVTWLRYEHVVGTTWTATGYAWQEHSGCTAPSATPTKHESIYKTNTCSPPKMYKWTGAAWEEMGYGTGVVITANNGLYKPTTSSVRAGGPLVENTNINGKATYTLTLDSMYLVTIKANRTSGTGASRMTMGSTNLIGVDIVHYNTADLDNIGQITANFNTGNIMSLANGSLITSFTQYLSGGTYRSEWYASNGTINRIMGLGHDYFSIQYLDRQSAAEETGFMMWDTISGKTYYQSPDILASIFGDNWGSQTVSSTARFSGNGTSGSPLELANGTAGSFLRSGASVPTWETAASLQGSLLLPSGTSGQTLRYGSAWTANSLLYNDGTNVGINTTSPAQKLDVNGEMSVNGVLFGKGPGTGTDNVRAGYNSLISNTTGYNNSAIGSISLSSNTTGYNNMAIGSSCLAGNTTGNQNLAIGTAAMYGNTTGFNNVGIGTYALVGNVTGAFNAAVGHSTAQSNTVGNYCTAIGAYALNSNTTGDANIGIGMNAGYYITTGSYNTVIGSFSNTDITTGSNNTIIGSNITGLTSSLSNNIILADGAGTQRIRVLSDGKTGIGTTTPLQTLHVAGTARITGSDGTATGLMGRDADGDVSGVGLSVGLEFSGGNIQADIGSGLNISGNDIAWGGTLTENTTVDVDGFDLEFVGLPTATTEEDVMLVGTGGLLVKGTIPITAIRAPGEATYSGANGATGETVTWQPEDVNVDADPTAGKLTVELNGGMYTGVHYSLFGCCNLTYDIILSGTMKLTGEYGTVASYTLTAGQHLEVVKFSDNSFRVSKK